MGNKVYIIPDVHCRSFYKPVLQIKDSPIVFLGDYMDPYRFEGTNDEEGIANLEEIFEFAKSNNNVTLLAGNHDCSWIWSRMDFERTSVIKYYGELHRLYRDNISLLKTSHIIDNVLFTHAGINNYWIEAVNTVYYPDSDFKLDKKNVLDWIGNEWLNELKRDTAIRDYGYYVLQSPIFWCSWSRGGIDPAAGLFWRDHYDDDDYPIEDFYTQIYGHTRTEEIGMLRKSQIGWCLDSRAIFELDLDTKELKFSDINEDKVRQSIQHRYCESI